MPTWSRTYTIGTLSSSIGQRKNVAEEPIPQAPFRFGTRGPPTIRGGCQIYLSSDGDNLVEDVKRGCKEFITPSIEISLPLIEGTVIYTPSIGRNLPMSHMASTTTFNAPEFGQTIPMAHVASTTAFNAPQINRTLPMAHVASTTTFNAPQINRSIPGSHIASTTTFNAPQIDRTLPAAHMASTTAFNAPQINRTIPGSHIASTTEVHAPRWICYTGSWVAGKSGYHALHLSASNDSYVQVGDPSHFAWMHGKGNASAFKWTVGFWVKFDDPTSQQYQALFRTHGGTQGPGVAIDYDDRGPGVRRQIHVGVRNASAIIANFSTETSEVPIPPASEWHHITVTYDQSATGTPTNLYMYVDGAHKGNWKGTKDGDETPSQNNSNMALRLGGIQHEQGLSLIHISEPTRPY